MKVLILSLFILPTFVFANSSTPFKSVIKLGQTIAITFKDEGIRYKVNFKNKEFISNYGQVLTINKGEYLTLVERHTKLKVTATSTCLLKVNSKHTWRGKVTENDYEINSCIPKI